MAGRHGLGNPEDPLQIADTELPLPEQAEHPEARRVGEGPEHQAERFCLHIYAYAHIILTGLKEARGIRSWQT